MSHRFARVLLPAGTLLAVFGLWGVDLLTFWRARQAPVAAIPNPPNLAWSCAVLGLGLVLAALCARGWRRRLGPEYRAYRLPPILLVSALFVELFVFGGDQLPITSGERLQAAIQLLAQAASDASRDGQVPRDPAVLQALAVPLGAPAYLAHGAPAAPFRVQVRQGCEGPVREAPGTQLGTLLYCVGKDGKEAWVSAVALPAERTYGPPSVYSRGGVVQWAKASATPPNDRTER